MSSDEASIHSVQEISDNKQNNEILDIGENLQDQEEQTEEVQRDETADGDGADDRTTVKPKRIIRNPRPKLNAETLKGPKGIAALESYFERVKFKGKGKEQQDLEVAMKTYEYWCHRLFPKFPFDTCIEKLEVLGNKRPVQTHIKRIRFDLLIEDKPILDGSDEEPNVEGFVNIQNDEITQQQNQRFDQLLTPTAPAAYRTPVALTEEQLERIRLNKERAEKLKQERLKKIRGKAEESLQGSSQLPSTSGLECEVGLVPSDVANSTQSDIFSHTSSLEIGTNTQNDLNEIEESALFDHESNVKGKEHVKGTIIKKSSKLNKNTAVFDSDSRTSDDDKLKDTFQNEYVPSQEDSGELSDDVQNSPVGGLAHKKKSKRKITIYDSDDQSSDEENQKQKEISLSERANLSSGDNSENENYTKRNISHKKWSKHSVLMDTDESDQENELNNQSSKQLNVSKTRKQSNDYNNSDQELSNINITNSLNGLVKNSSDWKYKKRKRNFLSDSDDDQSSDEENQNQKEIPLSETTKPNCEDSEDENLTKRNNSHKKQFKHSVLIDTDESDQEKKLNNQSSKKTYVTETTEKSNDLDINNSDQELLDQNKTNSLDGLVENLSDLTSSVGIAKTNIKTGNVAVAKLAKTDERLNNNEEQIDKINNDHSIDGVNEHSSGPKSQVSNTVKPNIETDSLVAVVEMDDRLNSDKPIETIAEELEAVLKSNQDTQFINS